MKINKNKLAVSLAFLLPLLIIYTVLVVYPIVYSVILSAMKWDGIGEMTFVGAKNYAYISSDPRFLTTLGNSMTLTGVSMVLQIGIGVIVAYLLLNTKRGMKAYRAVYFLPVVIASTAVATMFRIILNSDIGVVDSFLKLFGSRPLRKAFLSDKNLSLWCVIGVQVWQHIGTYVIIFLSAFQSIDEGVFESARIDGANSLQIFLRVACPLVKEIFCIALVFCFTGSMKCFDIPYVMTGGGPGYSSSYVSHYLFKLTFLGDKQFGVGAATAVVIVAISLLATILINRLFAERNHPEGVKSI